MHIYKAEISKKNLQGVIVEAGWERVSAVVRWPGGQQVATAMLPHARHALKCT